MSPHDVLNGPMLEAYRLLPDKMHTAKADIMLIAIGLQESRFKHRRQIKGPARGFWQFERGGGTLGVLSHPASRSYARTICSARGDVVPASKAVYNQLEHDDVLAAAFARLLLWTDPFALPDVCDKEGAWQLYIRTWRPGKPHRHTWDEFHKQAVELVTGNPIA